jgi:glycosyltransferase involved in cell wall biosynthesis
MSAPTLWIGVPSYNHARYLPGMLDALLAQSYRPLGITVIDDASTDDSAEIARGYARRNPIVRVIVHERNLGVTATLEELLEMATGDYFYAPAVDDRVLPGMLEKSMAVLARHPSAGLCSAQVYAIDQDGVRTKLDADNPLGLGPQGYYMAPAQCRALVRRPAFWVHGNTAIFRRGGAHCGRGLPQGAGLSRRRADAPRSCAGPRRLLRAGAPGGGDAAA